MRSRRPFCTSPAPPGRRGEGLRWQHRTRQAARPAVARLPPGMARRGCEPEEAQRAQQDIAGIQSAAARRSVNTTAAPLGFRRGPLARRFCPDVGSPFAGMPLWALPDDPTEDPTVLALQLRAQHAQTLGHLRPRRRATRRHRQGGELAATRRAAAAPRGLGDMSRPLPARARSIEPHIPIVSRAGTSHAPRRWPRGGDGGRARDRASPRAAERRSAPAASRAAGSRGVVPERCRGALRCRQRPRRRVTPRRGATAARPVQRASAAGVVAFAEFSR